MQKILIYDVPHIPHATAAQFEKLGLEVLQAEVLTQGLIKMQLWGNLDPQKTLLVFPGNGASIVRAYLPTSWLKKWKCARVHAKRYWKPGMDPRIVVTRISDQMLLGVWDVVVIDDVISSGQTMRKLRELNQPWIPGATWHALTWIAQRDTAQRKLKGFAALCASEEVGVKGSRIPINSLSTLLEHPEIAQSYAQRNFSASGEFLRLLEDLRA